MRVGVMIGPERRDTARKPQGLVRDIEWAEAAGMDTAWIPQIPSDFDALITIALLATRTTRIELGTAVVPLQAQHPIALARQALSAHAIANGRLALGVGPSHHWIVRDMLGLPYERPAAYTRDYLDVLNAALNGPGRVDVENDSFTVHNPLDLGPVAPLPVLVSALGPVMLRIAGERADGTVLWMADERAIGDHIAPADHQGRRQRRTPRAAHHRGHPGMSLCAGRSRCGTRTREPHPRGSRVLARTISGCWTRATRRTSATSARPVTRTRSWTGSVGSPTPA